MSWTELKLIWSPSLLSDELLFSNSDVAMSMYEILGHHQEPTLHMTWMRCEMRKDFTLSLIDPYSYLSMQGLLGAIKSKSAHIVQK